MAPTPIAFTPMLYGFCSPPYIQTIPVVGWDGRRRFVVSILENTPSRDDFKDLAGVVTQLLLHIHPEPLVEAVIDLPVGPTLTIPAEGDSELSPNARCCQCSR